MSDSEFDLLIQAGRIVCPATGLDCPGAVAVLADRIVASGPDVSGRAVRTLDFPEATLLPGLVDLHAHPACEGSKYGVDPDVEFLPRGVTTVLSQGDAGADNWNAYRQTTIEASRTRVRMAINVSNSGETMDGGCLEDIDRVDVEACVRAIEDGGDLIWGIAVNVSEIACGQTDPREVMRRTLQVAERTERPLLYGIRRPSQWSWAEQMNLLRAGDVVTYCFRGGDWRIVADGKVRPEVRDARDRGILFDVGHGMASFDFAVAEAAIADGFAPDTISTDQYKRHVSSIPHHDLPRTLSKLIAAGMPESDAFAAVTSRPANVLKLAEETGTLAPGACADVTVLQFNTSAAPLVDIQDQIRPGGCWEPQLTIRAGQLIQANQ